MTTTDEGDGLYMALKERDRLRADFNDCNEQRARWKLEAERLREINARLLEQLRASIAELAQLLD